VRRRTFAIVLGAAIGGAIVSLILALQLLPFDWAIQFAPPVVAVALLAALFLPKFPLTRSPVAAERVLSSLAHELRVRQYRVSEKPGRIEVRIGRMSAVKIWARAGAQETEIRYQADSTPGGWGTIMFLTIFFAPLAPALVAMSIVLYIFVRVYRFAEGPVGSLVSRVGAEGVPPKEELRVALIDALAEARRLAEEAYESEKTSHQDSQAVVVLGAILAWVGFFAGIVLASPGTSPGPTPLLLAIGPAAAVGLVAGILVWRRFAPRIRSYLGWAERLRVMLEMETSRRGPQGSEPSTFETLLEASSEVPGWIEASRRAGLSRDPGAGYLLIGLAIWAVTLVEAATFLAFGASILAIVVGLGAVALGIALYVFYDRWRRSREEEARQSLAEFRSRLDGARDRMERYLRDL